MAHNNNSVRKKLIDITGRGLLLKAIALNVGIDVNDLSRFKGGMDCLKKSDVELLSEYLKAVVIPQRMLPNEKVKKSYRDMLFQKDECRKYRSNSRVGMSHFPSNKKNQNK